MSTKGQRREGLLLQRADRGSVGGHGHGQDGQSSENHAASMLGLPNTAPFHDESTRTSVYM